MGLLKELRSSGTEHVHDPRKVFYKRTEIRKFDSGLAGLRTLNDTSKAMEDIGGGFVGYELGDTLWSQETALESPVPDLEDNTVGISILRSYESQRGEELSLRSIMYCVVRARAVVLPPRAFG